MADRYSCGRGHIVAADDEQGRKLELTGYFCPICMGRVIGYEDLIDTRLLSPKQEASDGG